MLNEEQVIQEVVENVEVLPVEANSNTGKNLAKAGLIVAGVIGTVVLVKKVIAPKVRAWKEKKAAAKAQQVQTEEEAK